MPNTCCARKDHNFKGNCGAKAAVQDFDRGGPTGAGRHLPVYRCRPSQIGVPGPAPQLIANELALAFGHVDVKMIAMRGISLWT